MRSRKCSAYMHLLYVEQWKTINLNVNVKKIYDLSCEPICEFEKRKKLSIQLKTTGWNGASSKRKEMVELNRIVKYFICYVVFLLVFWLCLSHYFALHRSSRLHCTVCVHRIVSVALRTKSHCIRSVELLSNPSHIRSREHFTNYFTIIIFILS